MSMIDWPKVAAWLAILAFCSLFWMWVITALMTPGNPVANVAGDFMAAISGGR